VGPVEKRAARSGGKGVEGAVDLGAGPVGERPTHIIMGAKDGDQQAGIAGPECAPSVHRARDFSGCCEIGWW
jgi:hypothetical protein